jgi:hypothetical protein
MPEPEHASLACGVQLACDCVPVRACECVRHACLRV